MTMDQNNDIKAVAARLAEDLGPDRNGKVFIGIWVTGTVIDDKAIETDTIVCYVSEDYAGVPDLIETFEGHVIEFRQSYVRLREPEAGITWTGILEGVEYAEAAE